MDYSKAKSHFEKSGFFIYARNAKGLVRMNAWYSSEALWMEQWALQESDRLKASRIFKAAQSLEQRYRDNHKGEVNDPYRRPCILMPKKPNQIARVIEYAQSAETSLQ
jgi:hypothetical protein